MRKLCGWACSTFSKLFLCVPKHYVLEQSNPSSPSSLTFLQKKRITQDLINTWWWFFWDTRHTQIERRLITLVAKNSGMSFLNSRMEISAHSLSERHLTRQIKKRRKKNPLTHPGVKTEMTMTLIVTVKIVTLQNILKIPKRAWWDMKRAQQGRMYLHQLQSSVKPIKNMVTWLPKDLITKVVT